MNIVNEKGKTFSITLGMANALKKGDKLKWKKVCHSCGFNMPAYAGSYPVNCPICGVAFDTTNEEYMIYQQDGTPVGAVIQNESNELKEPPKINEADEAQQLAAAKKWILRNVEITGKSKKDPEELEAMKQLMKIKTFKELWSTLEKKHLFDKHAIKQLKMDLVDIMMDALGDKRA
jgi:uncharacterized Zn finger protein (UPF0148 family)